MEKKTRNVKLDKEVDKLKERVLPQQQWKPTEEQMKAFENVYDWYRDNSNFVPSMPLHDLYKDLKKLMEE